MVLEMAHIEVLEGKAAEFEAGVTKALPLFKKARGCMDVELHRVVERPNHYVLMVRWNTIDDHMVHFRESADFQVWRGLVGPYFANPPTVHHTEVAVR